MKLPFSATRLKVVSNTVSQLLGKAISAASTVVVSFVVARTLGPAGYGDFTKVTTYVAAFFLVADFGLNAMYLQKKSEKTYAALLGLRLAGSILLAFIAVAILAFIPHSSDVGYSWVVRMGIVAFVPAIVFQALITTSNALFQEKLRYELASVAIALGSVVTIVMMLLPIAAQRGILYPLFAMLVGTAVTTITALFFVKKLTGVLTFSVSPVVSSSLVLSAVPLGVTLLFNLVYFRFDSFVLAFTRSTVDVGIYGLAYKFFEVPLVLPTFFMNAVYPLMLQKQNEGTNIRSNEVTGLAQKSAGFLFFVSLLAIAAFWIGAPWLALIKTEFAASVAPLRVLSLSLPFFFLTSVTMWSLIALRKQTMLVAIYGTSMTVNMLCNLFFVPKFGYMAAAWITVASEGLVLLLSSMVLVRALSVKEKGASN